MVGCLLPLALQSCGSAYCFFDPLIRHRYGVDHRASQLFGKLCRIYRISFFIVYIAFVKSHYHGYTQFQKLCGKEKAPAEVRGIHYVDDGIGMLVLYIAACYALLRSERRHGICSRQIHRYDLLAAFVVCLLYRTFFSVHRHAGPVSDLFVPSRQRIIHGGLAAVGISCQCYTHFFLPPLYLVVLYLAISDLYRSSELGIYVISCVLYGYYKVSFSVDYGDTLSAVASQ